MGNQKFRSAVYFFAKILRQVSHLLKSQTSSGCFARVDRSIDSILNNILVESQYFFVVGLPTPDQATGMMVRSMIDFSFFLS